ncbi:MAG: hypothetical protein PHO02_00340 [Candidatus Nanoarchaeia archaeon]|nr:hypothetical protein [Candidatus Nanoarchaeia archaeon]
MKKAIFGGLAALALGAGCATTGVNNRETTIDTIGNICNEANVAFMEEGFRVECGEYTFEHRESYNSPTFTVVVYGGCENLISKKPQPGGFFYERFIDTGCNQTLDVYDIAEQEHGFGLIYEERPARQTAINMYNYLFESLNVRDAAHLWEKWKNSQ